jgi:hypothetical protein
MACGETCVLSSIRPLPPFMSKEACSFCGYM